MTTHHTKGRRLLVEPLESRRVMVQYAAYTAPVLPELQLTPGVDGALLRQGDAPIDLGSRTFTFYGKQYTGEQVLLPTAPGILYLGDDSVTGLARIRVLAGSFQSSRVVYAFRDVTHDGVEDLVVQWDRANGVFNFQAVLELGSGEKQGLMLFNYLDIDDPHFPKLSEGRSSTIAVNNDSQSTPQSYFAYKNGYGDIGVRSGMGLVLKDDARSLPYQRLGESLHVFGSFRNDRLGVGDSEGSYVIRHNNTFYQFGSSDIHAIYLHGAGGDDEITAPSIGQTGNENDFTVVGLDGNGGNDSLIASESDPRRLFGGAGDDLLVGARGGDELEGGPGDDVLRGFGGDDVYYFTAKTTVNEVDTVEGSNGVDRIDFSMVPHTVAGRVDLNSDTHIASTPGRIVKTFGAGHALLIEQALGGAGNDVLIGNELPNVLRGGLGDDRLEGGPQRDLLEGGLGDDRLIGGQGDDTYQFLDVPDTSNLATETDTLVEAAGQGLDTLDFSNVPHFVSVNLSATISISYHGGRSVGGNPANLERVLGGAGDDRISGNALDNILVGNDGNDILIGNGGKDQLFGGRGNDTLKGGGGNDDLFGGFGNDRYLFALAFGQEIDYVFEQIGGGVDVLSCAGQPSTAPVTINLSQNNLATQAGRKVWTGIEDSFLNFENATGGDGDDTLIGNSGDNRLFGGPGDDTFDGRGGTDEIVQ